MSAYCMINVSYLTGNVWMGDGKGLRIDVNCC